MCSMLRMLNEIALQNERQHFMTNNGLDLKSKNTTTKKQT